MQNKKYTVYVAEIFHMGEPGNSSILGEYATYEEAVEASKKLIDDFIAPHTDREEFGRAHYFWGEEPWISPEPEGKHFSGSEYNGEAVERHFKNLKTNP